MGAAPEKSSDDDLAAGRQPGLDLVAGGGHRASPPLPTQRRRRRVDPGDDLAGKRRRHGELEPASALRRAQQGAGLDAFCAQRQAVLRRRTQRTLKVGPRRIVIEQEVGDADDQQSAQDGRRQSVERPAVRPRGSRGCAATGAGPARMAARRPGGGSAAGMSRSSWSVFRNSWCRCRASGSCSSRRASSARSVTDNSPSRSRWISS